MKRLFAAMLPFALTLTLLAGCGGGTAGGAGSSSAARPEQSAQEQGSGIPAYTPAEIRENNRAETLLTHHSALTYTRTFADGEGNVSGTVCEQFTLSGGFLQTSSAYADETGTVIYSQQGYADNTYPGATYGLSSDGGRYMTLYPNDETYESLCDTWLAVDEDGMTETVTGTSEQDGAVIVTARTDYRDEADVYEITLYYVDPETDDLLYMEATSYNTQDDSVAAVVQTQISYDDPVTFEDKPFETVITDSDYCEVSLIVDPQQDDMTVSWYPVAHGTQLSFAPISDYTLYADEELTQEIDASLGIDISGEVCNIFAVPQQG